MAERWIQPLQCQSWLKAQQKNVSASPWSIFDINHLPACRECFINWTRTWSGALSTGSPQVHFLKDNSIIAVGGFKDGGAHASFTTWQNEKAFQPQSAVPFEDSTVGAGEQGWGHLWAKKSDITDSWHKGWRLQLLCVHAESLQADSKRLCYDGWLGRWLLDVANTILAMAKLSWLTKRAARSEWADTDTGRWCCCSLDGLSARQGIQKQDLVGFSVVSLDIAQHLISLAFISDTPDRCSAYIKLTMSRGFF